MVIKNIFFFLQILLVCPYFLEYGVFARKFIPKRTQFGPLEGKIIPADSVKREESVLDFRIEGLNGSITALDTSDESKLFICLKIKR